MLVHVLREYNTNRIFLSCLGCWPFQSKLAKHVLPMFCFVIDISYLPFEILTLYEHRKDGNMVFESCYQMVITFAFLTKLLNQLWNRDKFRCMYEVMEDHWNTFTSDLEAQILKEYSTKAHKFTMLYAIIMYSMMSMFITIPTLMPILLDILSPLNESRPKQMAIYAEFGIDKDKYFVWIFSYTSIMIVVGISIMVAAVTIHMVCTAHACSLFQLISQQIENITLRVKAIDEIDRSSLSSSYDAVTNFESFNEQIIYEEYIVCLKKYQLALEFVDILNDTHRMIAISFSLLTIGATFSLVGIRIVYVLDQMEEMVRFAFIIMGAMLQLMIVCYSGQKLMDESQNIFYRAYAAEWYRFSPRLKSLLIITLYRSIVPCKLTVGNLFPLSMTIASSVIRTGVSYFTTFLSLKE